MLKSYFETAEQTCGPVWSQAWWWLGIPLATAAAIIGIYAFAPAFYMERMLPEAYGVLELSHFLIPLAGFFICLGLLSYPIVKSWPLLRWAIILFALACFYIAGEEHSWGQWFFYWDTPEFWGDINRQNETNLHNTIYVFNQLPQNLLKIAIVIGGLVLPLSYRARRLVARFPIITVLTPSVEIVPVALTAVAFNILTSLDKYGLAQNVLARPSEAAETFYYMFILFYLIILRRRLKQQQALPE